MGKYKLQICEDSQELSCYATSVISSSINLTLRHNQRAKVSLCGGTTPSRCYELLGKENLPWERVDISLGDERWVDLLDQSSNARMIRETLLQSPNGCRAAFEPTPTTQFLTPEDSAFAFSRLVEKLCPGKPPIFDLILLGLGDDGHTASLFPYSDSLAINDRWVTVSYGKGLQRITLTAPVLSAARKIIFLVSGETKQLALKRLLDEKESFERTPARLVQPLNEVLILCDKTAASLL